MLFKQRLWPGMRDGSIAVTFRRWKRSQATPGRRYRTGAGLIEVDTVDVVGEAVLTDDAARAGPATPTGPRWSPSSTSTPTATSTASRSTTSGRTRAAPSARTPTSTDDDHAAIAARLARYDRASTRGPWTRAALDAIAARPAVRAGDLAEALGRDRASFKLDVRKLKELGLTESLEVGYRLSPRGRAVLDRLAAGS